MMTDELPISAARADQHIVVSRCEVMRMQANKRHIHGRIPTCGTAFYSAPPCHGGVFDSRRWVSRSCHRVDTCTSHSGISQCYNRWGNNHEWNRLDLPAKLS